MRAAVLTDAHGNLPALQAALDAIRREGCDAICHAGDAIAIGPYPAETLDLLLHAPNVRFVMGNHDAWFAHGLPQPQPSWMSDGAVEHQCWVHSRLDSSLRSVVATWPYVLRETFEGVRVSFLHYGLTDSGRDFASIESEPTPADLDRLFAQEQTDLVFYGHDHRASDCMGRARYVNPGALGCHTEPVARFVLLECAQGCYRLEHRAVPYDNTALFAEFERRKVPDREFICRVFFGRT